MYSWIALGLLIIIACGLLSILQWRAGRHLKHLPTFPYLPIIGNLHYVLGDSKNFLNIINESSIKIDETNLPFLVWMATHPVFVISDLDDAKLVSNEFVDKPYFYNFLKVWLGNGIGTAPGHIWKNNIKKLGGMFSQGVVDNCQDIFNALAQKLVKSLKSKVGNEPFDMKLDLVYMTFDSACEAALGVPDASTIVSVEQYHNALTYILEALMSRCINVHLHPDLIFKRTTSGKKVKENVALLHGISETIIKEYMQKRSKQEMNNISENPELRKNTYIETLLDMNLSEQELIMEVTSVIFAGQEALTTELFFIFLNIGGRKDVQEKLFNEMKEIFGDSKRDVRKEDLDRMVYCEAVINETLRLYPTAPMASFRKVDRDFKIKSCTIPKGASCILNAWGSGRSKRLWGADALEFNPDRWSVPTNTPSNLMTFSVGKRPCIGRKYAYSFIKTALAYSIRELIFTSELEKVDLKLDIVLIATEGNLMQLKLREEKRN